MIFIVDCCHSAKLCAHAARVSDRNKMVLWPGCGRRGEFSLHTKNVGSVWFVVKRRGCCCNLSVGVALIVWFTTNGMCVKNNTIIYQRRAWTASGLDILQDTWDFFESGLDLNVHFWKKLDQDRIRILVWFLRRNFSESDSRCHKRWWQCFLCYGFYIVGMCCTHRKQW